MWLVSKKTSLFCLEFETNEPCSDPLPFQWLSHDEHLCINTKFIDVDYEDLMKTKREVIESTPRMKDLLHPTTRQFPAQDTSVLLDTQEYAAIGCDLRNLGRLGYLLNSVADLERSLILCVAEVSITYMPTEAADELIAWTARLSPGE